MIAANGRSHSEFYFYVPHALCVYSLKLHVKPISKCYNFILDYFGLSLPKKNVLNERWDRHLVSLIWSSSSHSYDKRWQTNAFIVHLTSCHHIWLSILYFKNVSHVLPMNFDCNDKRLNIIDLIKFHYNGRNCDESINMFEHTICQCALPYTVATIICTVFYVLCCANNVLVSRRWLLCCVKCTHTNVYISIRLPMNDAEWWLVQRLLIEKTLLWFLMNILI